MVSRARSEDDGPGGTALEVAASLLDVALPGVGPVFKRLAGQTQAELMRARSVALAAAERSSEMTREELADAIARSPKLIPLVTRLLHAAGQNGYDKTLKAMGTAFGEAVLDPDRVDDCELLLTSLADLGANPDLSRS